MTLSFVRSFGPYGIDANLFCMTKKVETIGGVPVTEEMIQAWADEAEAGYTPDQLHALRRGRPLMEAAPAAQISVRRRRS